MTRDELLASLRCEPGRQAEMLTMQALEALGSGNYDESVACSQAALAVTATFSHLHIRGEVR